MLNLTPPNPNPETCWQDDLGDRLEAAGIDPGCIFEFHENLRPDDLHPGGVVVSTLSPGAAPRHPWDIQIAFVRRRNGEEVRLGPGNALLVSRWVTLHLC